MKINRQNIIIIFFFVLELMVSTINCFGQKYLPPAGKTLLIVGQDLQSEYNYNQTGYFPQPGGVTSYCDLYDLTNATAAYPYGGLGEKTDGTIAQDVNWGAGPLNTHNAAYGYPNSTLALGLYMTEQYFPGGLTQIANGVYDAQILRLANFIKNTCKPVFLRIGYECDGTWNTGYNNTTNYKNAFIHIVNTIRPIAPNAMMVLQAATSPVNDIIRGGHENIADWYPGDQYVDYLGYSWFLNVPNQFTQTDELLNLARAHHKPVMVCESTPQGYDLANLNYRYINTMLGGQPGTNPVSKTPDQIWSEWFQPFFQYIHTNSDVIRIVSYINADWSSQGQWASPYSQGYWGDSRIEVNPSIRQKWITETTSNFWIHGSSQLFQQLQGGTINTQPIITPPVISFINPQSNTLNAGGNLLVQVNVSGNDTINNVGLYLNGNLIRQIQTPLYTWGSTAQQDPALFNLTAGTYILKAVVTDKHANVYTKYDTVIVNAISTGGSGDTTPNGNPFPPDGKTLVLIGQTYTQEYQHYVSTTQKAPAGSSHYAELYTGKINQGDDGNNEAFLNYINQNYPNAYAELGISFKDNPAAGGYTGANAVWQACKDIVAGKWDTQIDNIAASLKSRPTMKFLVRIDYEVSLGLFANKTTTQFIDILNKYTSQGINPLENANQIPELDLQAYPNAYNYIAKRIREHNNVSNATFIFHPVRGFYDAKWLYPGTQYTDWFGMSMFNDDVCWPSWSGNNPPYQNCPITQAMDGNVRQCLTWAKNTIKKPIIISESAAQSDIIHQNSPAFIDGYLDKIFHIIDTFDIKAFVYINSNWVSHGWTSQWGDSRVEKSPTSLQHWLTEVSKSRYIHYAGSTTVPPVCKPVSHASAQTLISGAAWNVAVHAADSANVTSVIFKENGIVMSQDAAAPFTYTYANPAIGNHTIQVITLFKTASCNDTATASFTVQPLTTTNNACTDTQTDYTLLFSQTAQHPGLDINFKSLVSSSFVDVYLAVNSGQARGIRLSPSQNTWTISLANDLTNNQALVNGNTLTFYFIYQKSSSGQVQTKSYSFALGSGCSTTSNTGGGTITGGSTGGGTTTPPAPCSDAQTDYSLQFSQPSNTQLNISFNSLVNSTFVDVYLAVNDEQPRGIRLSQSQNTWTINLNKDISTNQTLTNGEKLIFYFIYQKNAGGQVQTKSYTTTLGSGCANSTANAGATVTPALAVTNVYPQPSSGSVTIELNEAVSNTVVSITNMLGNTSHPGFLTNGNSLQINLNGLQSGTYMLHINCSNGSITKKIIVSQ